MKKRVFDIFFDKSQIDKIREVVNDNLNVVYNKPDTKNNTYYWDKLCAIMDRVGDIIDYLNNMELGKKECKGSAFDFYDFINCLYVLIDGIKKMGLIFEIDKSLIENIEKSQDSFGTIFGERDIDANYFEYIRSLCSVHPFETSRSKYKYLGENKLHCCPFVLWNDGSFGGNKDCDLIAKIYTSNRSDSTKNFYLYIDQFVNYAKKWIGLLPNICKAIDDYKWSVYENFKKKLIRNQMPGEPFENYLEYLKGEAIERFGDEFAYLYDNYIRVFKIEMSNSKNNIIIEKYRNAIKYAVGYEVNSLRNMNVTGFDNTGIKYSMNNFESSLFMELDYAYQTNGELNKYSYELGKMSYLLEDDVINKGYARNLLEKVKDAINKYVAFDNTESDEETIVLIKMAHYYDALTNYNLLNKNIPNDLKYRTKLLTKLEEEELLKEEQLDNDATDIRIIDDLDEKSSK